MNRPPRPQFVFRPNLRCEDDRRAWQLLQAAPDGNRKALIVRALLQSEQEHRLEETVRELRWLGVSEEEIIEKIGGDGHGEH